MKYGTTVAVCLAFAIGASVSVAKDIYVSQAGAGTKDGSSVANAHDTAWLNSLYSWGYAPAYGWLNSGATLIQPGDTVHLCGIINTPSAGYIVGLRGSGTNGGPITILFEPNAKISVPALSDLYGGGGPFVDPQNSLISGVSCNYMTIDGGSNGVIEATDNGTTNSYHNYFRGIYLTTVTNVTIQNLVISNLYQRIPNVDTNLGGGPRLLYNSAVGGNTIYIDGASNLTISNTVSWNVQDGISVAFRAGASNIVIVSNVIVNVNHALNVTGGGPGSGATANGIVIRGNKLDGFEAWEGTNSVPTLNPPFSYVVGGSFHRDGIFFFNLQGGVVTNVDVSGNIVGPGIQTPRSNVAGTGGIWLESFYPALFRHVRVYNNVVWLKYPLNWAPYWIFVGEGTDMLCANNTIVSIPDAQGHTSGGSFSGGGTNVMFFNNLVMGGSSISLSGYTYGGDTNTQRAYNLGWLSHIQSDYNVLTGFNTIAHSGIQIRHNDDQLAGAYGSSSGWTWSQNELINSLLTWQTTFTNDVAIELDWHSSTSVPAFVLGSYVPAKNDVVARGAGTNLSAYFTTDFNGSTRPSSGPWTIGAFEIELKPHPPSRFKATGGF